MKSIRPYIGIFSVPNDKKNEEHIIERFAQEYIKANPTLQDNSKLALALNFTSNPIERQTTLAVLINALPSLKINNYRNINIALKFVTQEERNLINEILIDLAFKNETLNKHALSSLAISIKHEIKSAERVRWIKLILNKLSDHQQPESRKKFLNHFLSPLAKTLPNDELDLFNALLNESRLVSANHLNTVAERIITAIQFHHDQKTFLPKNPPWHDIFQNLDELKNDMRSKSSLRKFHKLCDDEIPALHSLEIGIPNRYTDRIIIGVLALASFNPPTHYWKFLRDIYPYTSQNMQQQIEVHIKNRINQDYSDTDQNWVIHDIYMSLQNLEIENEYLSQINKIIALRDSPSTLQTINTNDNSGFMCDVYSHYLAQINLKRALKNEAELVLFEKTELPDVLIGVSKSYI